jgi:hypothetical protein
MHLKKKTLNETDKYILVYEDKVKYLAFWLCMKKQGIMEISHFHTIQCHNQQPCVATELLTRATKKSNFI